jgi:hypothetical protein
VPERGDRREARTKVKKLCRAQEAQRARKQLWLEEDVAAGRGSGGVAVVVLPWRDGGL